MMINWDILRYRGFSAAELDELIDTHKRQRTESVILENARLRQENAQLQQRDPTEAKTIGQIIQALLDRGFFVAYHFDRAKCRTNETPRSLHRFELWKYHGEDQILARAIVDDFEMQRTITLSIPRLESVMRQIDEQLTQRRLLEEALDG